MYMSRSQCTDIRL